jgi:hypothetical protein
MENLTEVSTALNELLEYLSKKDSYIDKESNCKVGDIIHAELDFLYGSDKEWYEKNDLIVDNLIGIEVVDFKFFPDFKIMVKVLNENNFTIKELYRGYVKKIDLL